MRDMTLYNVHLLTLILAVHILTTVCTNYIAQKFKNPRFYRQNTGFLALAPPGRVIWQQIIILE